MIDASGLHVYPGMIDAGSVLGLVEVDSARETRDHAEGGDFQPDLLRQHRHQPRLGADPGDAPTA